MTALNDPRIMDRAALLLGVALNAVNLSVLASVAVSVLGLLLAFYLFWGY